MRVCGGSFPRIAHRYTSPMICKSCGTVNSSAPAARGSGWIELVLWLTFIIPIALIYSIWRRTGTKHACQACGSQDLVGVGTPVGRRLAAEYHPGGLPSTPTVPTQPARSLLAGVGRVFVLIGAAIIGTFVLVLVLGQLTT